jgi:hypothetical protein
MTRDRHDRVRITVTGLRRITVTVHSIDPRARIKRTVTVITRNHRHTKRARREAGRLA